MNPAPSIVFFTTASGAGYGLLFWLGTLRALGWEVATPQASMYAWARVPGVADSITYAVNAAEQTGVASGAFDITTTYLKTRKQFGQLIGEFQALQHRAAHLYSEIEIADATVMKAQQLLDAGSEKAELMVAVAKAKAGKASSLAVREGVQMHGGVGMTDEFDIGLYMKRDRALAEFLGDQYYHAQKVAELSGY